MKLYLAGRYRDQAFLRSIREALQRGGREVTSRWLDAVEPEDRPDDPDWANGYATKCAERDIEDIEQADSFILYLRDEGSTRGGMYVELGFAISGGLEICLVGPRTNVFTYLSRVNQFDTWDAFFDWLFGETPDESKSDR